MFKILNSSVNYSKCNYPAINNKSSCDKINIGGFNRLSYDLCDYNKRIQESVSPFSYQLYFGAHEHSKKCNDGNFWRKFDVVDIESDLFNINRPASRCPQFKYNKSCGPSKYCISTFSSNIPRILDRDICPIVFNNIPKIKSNMLPIPETNINSTSIFGHFKL